jgi:hypothetical protein
MLLNLVFSNLRLNEGNLRGFYTKPFEILANSVIATNKIFEPQFLTQKRAKKPEIDQLLPSSKIIIILEDWNYISMIKEKLLEIKRVYRNLKLSPMYISKN